MEFANRDFFIIDSDTIKTIEIEWINQRVLLKPVGLALGVAGSSLVLFGSIAWASNVGSEDTWTRLGAVIGALIGITGGIIDAAALPILLKARKYKINGQGAKWQIE